MQTLSAKRPNEAYPIAVGFTKPLAKLADVVGTAQVIQTVLSVTVNLVRGTDASSSTFVVPGSAVISSDGKSVVLELQSGVDECNYEIVVKIRTNSNKTLEGVVMVPVRA